MNLVSKAGVNVRVAGLDELPIEITDDEDVVRIKHLLAQEDLIAIQVRARVEEHRERHAPSHQPMKDVGAAGGVIPPVGKHVIVSVAVLLHPCPCCEECIFTFHHGLETVGHGGRANRPGVPQEPRRLSTPHEPLEPNRPRQCEMVHAGARKDALVQNVRNVAPEIGIEWIQGQDVDLDSCF
jgi:hypothetical protein